MQDLRGRPDNHDFVIEKRAIAIVGVPKFRIENLVERPRKISIVGAEREKMVAFVVDHVCIPTQLDQCSGRQ